MTIRARHNVTVNATIDLNESEIRALDALAGYGADSFLKVFYEHLGKAYMGPHEHGLRTLFEKIEKELKPAIYDCNRARKALIRKPNPGIESEGGPE